MSCKLSQLKKVLTYLKEGKMLTSMEAFKMWNITRLSSIIHVLRHKYKLNIVNIKESNFVRYCLVEE